MTASATAKAMIAKYGMSDETVMVDYMIGQANRYLGGGADDLKTDLPDSEKAKVWKEVKALIDNAYEFSHKVLSDPHNKKEMERMVKILLERESINGDEALDMINLNKLPDPYKTNQRHNAKPSNNNKGPNTPGLGQYK